MTPDDTALMRLLLDRAARQSEVVDVSLLLVQSQLHILRQIHRQIAAHLRIAEMEQEAPGAVDVSTVN